MIFLQVYYRLQKNLLNVKPLNRAAQPYLLGVVHSLVNYLKTTPAISLGLLFDGATHVVNSIANI